jgi:hypothetical protein
MMERHSPPHDLEQGHDKFFSDFADFPERTPASMGRHDANSGYDTVSYDATAAAGQPIHDEVLVEMMEATIDLRRMEKMIMLREMLQQSQQENYILKDENRALRALLRGEEREELENMERQIQELKEIATGTSLMLESVSVEMNVESGGVLSIEELEHEIKGMNQEVEALQDNIRGAKEEFRVLINKVDPEAMAEFRRTHPRSPEDPPKQQASRTTEFEDLSYEVQDLKDELKDLQHLMECANRELQELINCFDLIAGCGCRRYDASSPAAERSDDRNPEEIWRDTVTAVNDAFAMKEAADDASSPTERIDNRTPEEQWRNTVTAVNDAFGAKAVADAMLADLREKVAPHRVASDSHSGSCCIRPLKETWSNEAQDGHSENTQQHEMESESASQDRPVCICVDPCFMSHTASELYDYEHTTQAGNQLRMHRILRLIEDVGDQIQLWRSDFPSQYEVVNPLELDVARLYIKWQAIISSDFWREKKEKEKGKGPQVALRGGMGSPDELLTPDHDTEAQHTHPTSKSTEHAEQAEWKAFLLQTKVKAMETLDSDMSTLVMLLIYEWNIWRDEASALRELVDSTQSKQIAIRGHNTEQEQEERAERIGQQIDGLEPLKSLIDVLRTLEQQGETEHQHPSQPAQKMGSAEFQEWCDVLRKQYRLIDGDFEVTVLEGNNAQIERDLRNSEEENEQTYACTNACSTGWSYHSSPSDSNQDSDSDRGRRSGAPSPESPKKLIGDSVGVWRQLETEMTILQLQDRLAEVEKQAKSKIEHLPTILVDTKASRSDWLDKVAKRVTFQTRDNGSCVCGNLRCTVSSSTAGPQLRGGMGGRDEDEEYVYGDGEYVNWDHVDQEEGTRQQTISEHKAVQTEEADKGVIQELRQKIEKLEEQVRSLSEMTRTELNGLRKASAFGRRGTYGNGEERAQQESKPERKDDIVAINHSRDTDQNSDHPCGDSLRNGVPRLRGSMGSPEEEEECTYNHCEYEGWDQISDLSEQEALRLCDALFDTEDSPVKEHFQMYGDDRTWWLTTDSFGHGYETYQGKILGPTKIQERNHDDKDIYKMRTEIALMKSEIGRRLHELRYTLDLDGIMPPIKIDLPPQFTIPSEESSYDGRLVFGEWSTVFHFPDGATPEQMLGLQLPRKDLGQGPHDVHIPYFGAPFMEKRLRDAIAAGLRETVGPSWEELTDGMWQDVGKGDTYVISNKDITLDWGERRHHGNRHDEYIEERACVNRSWCYPDIQEDNENVCEEHTSQATAHSETCDVCAQDEQDNEKVSQNGHNQAQEVQDATAEDSGISTLPAATDSDDEPECDNDLLCRRSDCTCPIRIAVSQYVVTSLYDGAYFGGMSLGDDELVEVLHFPGGATQDQIIDSKIPRVNFRSIPTDAEITHIESPEEEQELKIALELVLQKWYHSFEKVTCGRWPGLGRGDTYIAGKKHILFPGTDETKEPAVCMRGGNGGEELEVKGDYEHDAKRMQQFEEKQSTAAQKAKSATSLWASTHALCRHAICRDGDNTINYLVIPLPPGFQILLIDSGLAPPITSEGVATVYHFPGGATRDIVQRQAWNQKCCGLGHWSTVRTLKIATEDGERDLKNAMTNIWKTNFGYNWEEITRGKWPNVGQGDTYLINDTNVGLAIIAGDQQAQHTGMRGGHGEEPDPMIYQPIQRRKSDFQGHAGDFDRIYDDLLEETAEAYTCSHEPPSDCTEAWITFATVLQTRNHALEHELEEFKNMHHDLIHDLHWQIGTTVELEEQVEAAEEEKAALMEELENLKPRWKRLADFVAIEADRLHRHVKKETVLSEDHSTFPRVWNMRGGDDVSDSTPPQEYEKADDPEPGPDHLCAAKTATSFDFFPKRATIVFAGDPPHIYQFSYGTTLEDIRMILDVGPGNEFESSIDEPYCARILEIMKIGEGMGVRLPEDLQDERVTIGIPYVPPGTQVDNGVIISEWQAQDTDLDGLDKLVQRLDINAEPDAGPKGNSRRVSASSEEEDYYQDLGDLVNTLNNTIEHNYDTGSPRFCICQVCTNTGRGTYFDVQHTQQTPVVSVRGGGNDHGHYQNRGPWTFDPEGNRQFPLLSPKLPKETNAPPNTPGRYGTFTPGAFPAPVPLPSDRDIATSNEPLGLRLSRLMFPPKFVQEREHTIRRFSWRHTKQKNPQYKDKSSRRYKYTKGSECEDWETQLDKHREHCDYCQSVFLEEEYGTRTFEPAEDIRHEDDAPVPGSGSGRPWERSTWPENANTSPFPIVEDPDPRFRSGAEYQDPQLRGGAGHERDLEVDDDHDDWRSERDDVASQAQSSIYQGRAFRYSSTLSTRTSVHAPSPVERNFRTLRRPETVDFEDIWISSGLGEYAPPPYHGHPLRSDALSPSKTSRSWLAELTRQRGELDTGTLSPRPDFGQRSIQYGLARSINDRFSQLQAENWLESPRPAPAPPIKRKFSDPNEEDEEKDYVRDIHTWEDEYRDHFNSFYESQSSTRQQSFKTDQYVCLASGRQPGLGRRGMSMQDPTLREDWGTQESLANVPHEQIRRLSPMKGKRAPTPKLLVNICKQCAELLAMQVACLKKLKERLSPRMRKSVPESSEETETCPAQTRSDTNIEDGHDKPSVPVSRLDTLKERVRAMKTRSSPKETPSCPAPTRSNTIFRDCYHQEPVRVRRLDKSPRQPPLIPTILDSHHTLLHDFLSKPPISVSRLNKSLPPTPQASTSTLNPPFSITNLKLNLLPPPTKIPYPKAAALVPPSPRLPSPVSQITLFERACAMAQAQDAMHSELVRQGTRNGNPPTVAGPSDLVRRAVWVLEWEEKRGREREEVMG